MNPPQGTSIFQCLRQFVLRVTNPFALRRAEKALDNPLGAADFFFYLYNERIASGFLEVADKECTACVSRAPLLVLLLRQERSREKMIGQRHLASAVNHDVQIPRSH